VGAIFCLETIPAAATTTLAMTTAPAPAAFARRHRTGFIHNHRATHEVAAIACLDRALASRWIVDVYETESTSFPGKTISHYVYCVHGNTRLRKKALDIGLASRIWQVADKKSHELNLLISNSEEAG
jgi:hypothetical protein